MFSFQFILNAVVICFCLVLAKNQIYRLHEMYINYRRAKINKKYWELQEKRENSQIPTVSTNRVVGTAAIKQNCKQIVKNKTVLKIFNPDA